MKTTVCRMCGTTIQTAGRYAWYCPVCKKKHDRMLDQMKRERERERKIAKKLEQERNGKPSLCEDNKAAKAAGLSYGQWVARGCP